MHRVALSDRAHHALVVALLSLAVLGAAPAIARHHRAAHPSSAQRAKAAARAPVPSGTQTIVAVGDSITKGDWDTAVSGGWVTRLAGKLRRAYAHTTFVVRNAGVDGDTTAGVLTRLARDVLTPRPDLVIVSIGTNDFDQGVSPAAFRTELGALVGRLHAAPKPPVVVLASMLPIAALSPQRLLAERAYDDIIRQTAAQSDVGFLDLFDPWLALGPTYLHALRHDIEHPNPIGYEFLASTTAAFLEAEYLDPQGRIISPALAPTCSPLVCGA